MFISVGDWFTFIHQTINTFLLLIILFFIYKFLKRK